MRVLVCGGRNYGNDIDERFDLYLTLRLLHDETPISALIQGGASGADECARDWAKDANVKCVTVPADWKTHGKAAGPIRNRRMLTVFLPDLVIAFPGGRGTADMVRQAEAAGIKVQKIEPQYALPQGA